jgi:hypothetical protein
MFEALNSEEATISVIQMAEKETSQLSISINCDQLIENISERKH